MEPVTESAITGSVARCNRCGLTKPCFGFKLHPPASTLAKLCHDSLTLVVLEWDHRVKEFGELAAS